MCNYILIHELWQVAWLAGQRLGRIGKLVTRKLGKEVQTSSTGQKKSEDICVLGECSQNGEHLNNQEDRLTHSVDTSQPLPSH